MNLHVYNTATETLRRDTARRQTAVTVRMAAPVGKPKRTQSLDTDGILGRLLRIRFPNRSK